MGYPFQLVRVTTVCMASHGVPQGSRGSSMYCSRRGIAHVWFSFGHVSLYLGNGAQGHRLFQLVVAECTRLTSCLLVGLSLLQPQMYSFCLCLVLALRYPHQAHGRACCTPARMCTLPPVCVSCKTWLGSRDCPQQDLPSIGPQACCPQGVSGLAVAVSI